MGKKKAIINEACERRCWENLAIAIILQALDDYTALDDDCVPLKSIIEVNGNENFRRYFYSNRDDVTKYSDKRFRQKDAFLFLNSSWFKLLNPTKYTGNELILIARRLKSKRIRGGFIKSLAQVINGGTSNDQN